MQIIKEDLGSEKIQRILDGLDLNDGYIQNGVEVWRYHGTDKNTLHSYIGAYDKLLTPYEDKEINLLEVGVARGGSFVLWKNLLPKAKIALVDIHDYMTPQAKAEINENSKLYIMDAYTEQAIEKLKENYPEGFDIIIEDGPHTMETQAYMVRNYLPLLKNGGVMVVEDLRTDEFIENLVKIVPDELKENVTIYDLRNVKNRQDDILFVIKK